MPSSDIIYRRADENDIPPISSLAHLLNKSEGDTTQPSESFLKQEWHNFDVYIACNDNEIIAYASGIAVPLLHMGFSRYDIHGLFVKKNFRKLGVAETLLKTLINDKKDSGFHFFRNEVSPKNNAAQNLYKKIGFTQSQNNHLKLNLFINESVNNAEKN